MSEKLERAAFEQAAEKRGMQLHKVTPCDGSAPYYLDSCGKAAWWAWQARASIPDPRLSQAVELLRGALSKIVATVQAQDGGGGFIVEYHGIDGEYLGSQPIDPMWIIQEMASIAQNAIADFDAQQKGEE